MENECKTFSSVLIFCEFLVDIFHNSINFLLKSVLLYSQMKVEDILDSATPLQKFPCITQKWISISFSLVAHAQTQEVTSGFRGTLLASCAHFDPDLYDST